MKQNKLLVIYASLFFVFSLFAITSCDKHGSDSFSNSEHDSTPSESTSSDVQHVHSWEVDEVVLEATCTTSGVTSYKCTSCGETKNEVINAFGHSEVIDEAVESTCTETGLTEGKHCSSCNEILVEQEIIDKLDHNYVEQVLTAATCISDGVTLFTCSVCNDFKYEITTAFGHSEVIDEAVEPTCTKIGLTEGKHCSTCNEILVKQEIVDALDHEYGSFVNEIPATCTSNGAIGHYYCKQCNTYFDLN